MAKPLLIGGIDVGLHTGLAFLDLDGNPVCIETLKNVKNSQILDRITELGKVMVLSTDRAKIPRRMKKISSSLSAKTILPAKNMTKKKKRLLVKDFLREELKLDSHEKSALASAIFAYRRFVPNFNKLRDKLKKENKLESYSSKRRLLFLRIVRDLNRKRR